MTQSGYVYGSYLNFQINLDPGKTKSRYQAKWRSQIPVRLDLGFHLTVGEDEYWRIENTTESGESNFSVNVVHIDDLDFQIKSTREVDDFFWIYKAPVAIIGGRAPIGKSLSIRDTYVPVERNLDTSNPNGDRFTAPVLVAKLVITPTFIDFAPQRLELGYDYGAVGGPEFKTDTIETANGARWRNALHYLPLGRWQLGDRMVAESDSDKLAEVSYLKSFHEARRGSYQGFRYKDWSDYYARNQYIATGDGVRVEFQLKKAYRAGDAVTYRPIQKPVFGTVELFVDGVNVAVDPDHEWVVNHDTGVISHPEPLPNGAVLSANFEFDVPVWFESDEIGFSLQAYEPESGDSIYRLESVFVVEGRIPLTLPWQIQEDAVSEETSDTRVVRGAVEINQPLDLGIIYDTIEKHSFFTDKLALANNFTRREIKREDTENIFNIGDRIFDREELDRLLGYFYTCRGSSRQFSLTDKQQEYLARLESDRLNIKFSAENTNDALFSVSGLKLDLKPKPKFNYATPPFSIAAEPIKVDLESGQQGEEAIVTESNPSTGGNGGGGGGASGGAASSTAGAEVAVYTLFSFKVENFSFTNSPFTPAFSKFRQAFWAGSTLNLLINDSNVFIWHHYRLNLDGGWNFVYQDSKLSNYKFGSLLNNFVFRVPDGVALVGRVYYPLPAPSNDATNGVLIWTINDSGQTTSHFLPDTLSATGKVGTPYRLIDGVLYLDNKASELELLGNYGKIAVYTGDVNREGEYFPLKKGVTVSGVQAPGSGIMDAVSASETGDQKSKILVDDEPYYEFFPDITGRKATFFKETWGSDGSQVVFSKTNNLCTNQKFGCSNEFQKTFYQIWHKKSWGEQWQLIEDFEELPPSDDATYKFQLSFADLSYRYRCDKHGNICQFISSISVKQPLLYYHKQAGHALDLKKALNLPSSFIVLLITNSPYGFVILGRNSQNNVLYLYMVQSS